MEICVLLDEGKIGQVLLIPGFTAREKGDACAIPNLTYFFERPASNSTNFLRLSRNLSRTLLQSCS